MFTSNVLKIVFIFFVGELSSQSFALWLREEIKEYKPKLESLL